MFKTVLEIWYLCDIIENLREFSIPGTTVGNSETASIDLRL